MGVSGLLSLGKNIEYSDDGSSSHANQKGKKKRGHNSKQLEKTMGILYICREHPFVDYVFLLSPLFN